MRLEETQMHEAQRLFKLAVVGLATACRTMQLVDARNGSPRPATDVIDAALLSAAEAIGATLEGKTERQKNPHPPHSLAWLAWIIARLGGLSISCSEFVRRRSPESELRFISEKYFHGGVSNFISNLQRAI